MTEDKMMRLSLVAKQIGVGTSTIVQKLSVQGHKVENNPNAKLNFEQLKIVAKEFGASGLLQESTPATQKAMPSAPPPGSFTACNPDYQRLIGQIIHSLHRFPGSPVTQP